MVKTAPRRRTRPASKPRLELDGNSLHIDDLVRVARHGEHVALAKHATERILASKALKEDLIAREIPIYGVTTGFGDSAHRQVSPDKAAKLQQNLVRHLGAGTG